MNPWRRCGLPAALALVCAGAVAFAGSGDDFAQRLTELQERRKTAQEEFMKKLSAEKDGAARFELWQKRPGKEFVADFEKLATEAKGTETAEKAWLEVFEIASGFEMAPETGRAISALLRDHIGSEGLGALAGNLQHAAYWYERADLVKALRTLVEKSPHAQVRASALFSLGTVLAGGSPEEKQEGLAAFRRVVAEYGELPLKRGGTWGERAKAWIFEAERLQIGMTVPDFESIDENGEKLRISDYRGKVVVLDFWGMW